MDYMERELAGEPATQDVHWICNNGECTLRNKCAIWRENYESASGLVRFFSAFPHSDRCYHFRHA